MFKLNPVSNAKVYELSGRDHRKQSFWLAVVVYHAFDWIPAFMDTLVNSNKTVCIVCYLCRDGLVLSIALTQGCALDHCMLGQPDFPTVYNVGYCPSCVLQ